METVLLHKLSLYKNIINYIGNYRYLSFKGSIRTSPWTFHFYECFLPEILVRKLYGDQNNDKHFKAS